jgi:flagellar secretion chaperone FliS
MLGMGYSPAVYAQIGKSGGQLPGLDICEFDQAELCEHQSTAYRRIGADMNTVTRGALDAYSKAGVESNIRDASPHKLISMLFDGALVAIGMARNHMRLNQIPEKGLAISRAISIIDEGLKVSLDENVGGELARNLKSLYEYLSNRLLMANIHNDVEGLDEVARLLGELKAAWDQIGQQAQAVAPPVVEPAIPTRPPVSYGKV